MRKTVFKLLSVLISMVICISIFSGCNSGSTQEKENTTKSNVAQAQEDKVTFPLKEQIKLTYWTPMSTNVSRTAQSFDQIELYQELEKRTNIDFEFIHPPLGQEKEVFNIMVASGQIPDIIEYGYAGYRGGITGALSDGLIIPLNDLIDKYMPNYKKMIQEYKDIDINTKNEEGKYMVLPFLLPKENPIINFGPVARKDLLEKAGVKNPETIDDWYTMLKELKAKTGVKWPMYMGNAYYGLTVGGERGGHSFIGAWDIGYTFYADNGKVKFGPAEPQYKNFLETLSKWYAEGLIDSEFPTVTTGKIYDAKSLGGEWGVFWAYVGPIEKLLTEGKKSVSTFDVVPLKSPVLKKGDKNRFMNMLSPVDNGRVTITSKNKYLKETAAFCDLGYGKEGSELYSLGIEGKSFKMENGKAAILPEIFNNKYNIPMTDALYRFCRGMNYGGFAIDKRFYEAYWYLPLQHEAMKQWSGFSAEFEKNDPRILGTPTSEESSKIQSKETEIKTYVDEMFIKFVMGVEPLSNFDKYLKTLKDMGLDTVTAVKQAQTDRAIAKTKK